MPDDADALLSRNLTAAAIKMSARGVTADADSRLLWQALDVSTPIADCIERHPDIGRLNGRTFGGLNSSGIIQSGSIAIESIRRVLAGVPADDVVRALKQFDRTEVAYIDVVHCLYGIEVGNLIALDDNVSICRPGDLPISNSRKVHLRTDGEGVSFFPFHFPKATAALVVRVRIYPAIFDAGEQDAHFQRVEIVRQQAEASADKAVAAIVLSGAVVERGIRYYEDVDVPMDISSGTTEWNTLPQWPRATEQIDAAVVTQLYVQAKRFADWNELARLTERLSRARLQRDAVDAHLDYGVIAESILAHGDKNHSEIRFRLGSRAGWVLGIDPASRAEYAKRAKKLYDLRSSAAHAGKLDKSWIKADRDDADSFCQTLLRNILERGSFISDWDTILFG